MKRIKLLTKTLMYISVFSFMASCGGDDVEIVSQDTSWTIDNKYIEEDIREQLGIDPYNKLVYFDYSNSPMLEMAATYDLTNVTIKEGDEVVVKVKMSSIFDEDVKMSLVIDEEGLKKCPENVTNNKLMTESSFTSEPLTIKAGELGGSFIVKLKNINQFNDPLGYILPLALKLEGDYKNLKTSQVRGNIFLRLKVTVQLDNIDSSNLPIEGVLFNEDVTFASDIRPEKLPYLNDGKTSGTSWYPGYLTNYLDATFTSKVLLKGIKVDSTTGRYCFGEARIYVDTGIGVWTDIGKFSRTSTTSIAYIKLKQPMECIKVRMQELAPNQTDLFEVNFIK